MRSHFNYQKVHSDNKTMGWLALVCSLVCWFSSRLDVALSAELEISQEVQTRFFSQILDHNATEPSYWQQRYFFSSRYWAGEASPVFLLVGAESEASLTWMTDAAWVDWGQEHGALLLYLEHRFYGQSRPTANASTVYLSRYLSSRQALSDITYFIDQINRNYNFTAANKWILFGGSYAGNLVAWARLKHPKHVFGAVSSSGPLQAKVDFTEYNKVVRDSLNSASPGCGDAVAEAVGEALNLLQTPEGRMTFKSILPICEGFNHTLRYDKATLIQSLAGRVLQAVESNDQLEGNSIAVVCSYMNDTDIAQPFYRLALYNNATTTQDCLYADFQGQIDHYRSAAWNDPQVITGERQWMFQTCNEFGYFRTSERDDSFLGRSLPLSYFIQMCAGIFGPEYNTRQMDRAVAATNSYYKGSKINVTRVVFLQGSYDPWHPLGMVQSSSESPFYYIPETSHTYDMLAPKDTDSFSLKTTRNNTNLFLTYWMKL